MAQPVVVEDNESLAHFVKFYTKHTRSNSNTLCKYESSNIGYNKVRTHTKSYLRSRFTVLCNKYAIIYRKILVMRNKNGVL